MKTNIILFLLFTFGLTHQAIAQDEQDKHEEGTNVEIRVGSAGGSFYDIPSNMQNMDKYGIEWVPARAVSGEILVEAEKLGSIDFRAMQLNASKTNEKLGGQYLLNFNTARYEVAKTKAGDIFLRSNFSNLNHKNRLVHYKIDGQTVPAAGDLSDNVLVNQNVLNAGPEIGLCKKLDSKEILPFTTLEGFADLSLKPVGMMISDYKVVSSNSQQQMTDDETKRLQLSSGGMVRVVGTVTYKDKVYLRLKFDQSYTQGHGQYGKVNLANRELELKVGYKMTPRLSVSAGIENNELVVNNNGRRAIDVVNIGTVGLSYNIGRKKSLARPR